MGNATHRVRGHCHHIMRRWSCGVILYICLSGFPPFGEEMGWHDHGIRKQVIEGIYRFDPGTPWDTISDEAKDLVTKMLTVNVDKRLDVQGAIDHPWMQIVMSRLVKISFIPVHFNLPCVVKRLNLVALLSGGRGGTGRACNKASSGPGGRCGR
jgi:serine/threonine protein kinase